MNKLRNKYGTNSLKTKLHGNERVSFQGVTGMDDSRRLKASVISRGYSLANSLNYIDVLDERIQAEYVLTLLNSQLLEWRFRLTSTNNNVNNYEIDALPLCRIDFTTPEPVRQEAVRETVRLYEAGSYAAVVGWGGAGA